MGYNLGSLSCITSATECHRKGFGEPSCESQVWFVGRRASALGYLDFVNFLGKRAWYLLRGDGTDLSTRIYFNSHGLGPITRGQLKVCIECYLTIRSVLSEELTFRYGQG